MRTLARGRHRLVIALWVVLLVVAVPFAARQNEDLTNGGYEVAGSESEEVETRFAKAFPNIPPERISVLIAGESAARPADYARAVRLMQEIVAEQEGVTLAPDEAARAARARGEARFIVPLAFQADSTQTIDLARELSDEIRDRQDESAPVQANLLGRQAQGAALQHIAKEDVADAEVIGFPVVLIVLLTIFGSLAAAALPLAIGAFSVTITGAVVYFLSQEFLTSVFVTNVASMVGIGVAVDYALFMLVRYREEISGGATPEQAQRRMLQTSGRAVIFSGITVMAAVALIFVIDNTALRSMATGAIVVVAISVLLATTLLPALLRVFGRFASEPGRIGRLASRAGGRMLRRRAGDTPVWSRWASRVMAHPWRAVIGAGSILVALTIPALSIDPGDDSLRQLPEDDPARRAATLAAQEAGAGAQSPLIVLARMREGQRADGQVLGAARELGRSLPSDRDVVSTAPPQVSADGATLFLPVIARSDSEDARTSALVRRLRDDLLPQSALSRAQGVESVQVGGSATRVVDSETLIMKKLLVIIALLLAVSFVLLLVLLRSVLLPLKAIVLNLLSVGAAWGVLVMVFQWDVLGPLFEESDARIQIWALPLILTVVFGLSMDYELFLLTRIKERFDLSGDNRLAVEQGIATSARAITSAALILVAVFAVFVMTGVPLIKQIGVGTAAAIALDATLVRLVLLPGAMQLMGRWNWWFPSWLDRIVPRWELERVATMPQPAYDGGGNGTTAERETEHASS